MCGAYWHIKGPDKSYSEETCLAQYVSILCKNNNDDDNNNKLYLNKTHFRKVDFISYKSVQIFTVINSPGQGPRLTMPRAQAKSIEAKP